MTEITTLFTLLKNASDLAKMAMQANDAIQTATLKTELAELMGILADARMGMIDLRDQLLDKDRQIEELQKAMELKDQVIQADDAFYQVGPKGGAVGKPFCLRCWEKDHKLHHLTHVQIGNGNRCPVCQTSYHGMSTGYRTER